MGLTGLEPVTLRLSSACSNQLSYRPLAAASPPNFRFSISDFCSAARFARIYLNRKSQIANRKSSVQAETWARDVALRTPDLKRISDIALIEPLGVDRKVRCRFLTATVSIWNCEGCDQSCDF